MLTRTQFCAKQYVADIVWQKIKETPYFFPDEFRDQTLHARAELYYGINKKSFDVNNIEEAFLSGVKWARGELVSDFSDMLDFRNNNSIDTNMKIKDFIQLIMMKL